MIKEKDIVNIQKDHESGLFNVELNKSSNNYKFFTTPWQNIPRFDNNGKPLTPEQFKDMIVERDGIVKFNQNYACAFVGSSYTLLSAEKLSSLVSEDYVELKDGKLRIYEYPKKGHQYIMAVDPAKDGIDAFAVQIVDISEMHFRQVACAKLQIDFLVMPEWLDLWGRYYNMAYIVIENNEGAGTYSAATLFQTYEYYNLFWEKSRETGKKKREAGFRTTSYSRNLILNTLRLFSDNDKIDIKDADTIQELYTFAQVDGKYQALEGCHDDMVMSLALVFAPFTDARNFDDMKAITKQIYNKGDNYEGEVKSLAHYLNNAVFDDFGDGSIESSPFDDRGDEFLGTIGDIRQNYLESSLESELGW